ncbi:MAG: hypothetical protein SFX18_06925, partial [Pirellulales bacterium]|nr:hypothetical protein [Pirellulales bacterium]
CREPKLLQYAEIAKYGTQLARCLRYFPREQLLLLKFEDFASDPGTVYRQVLGFLDLPDDGRVDFPKHNEALRRRNPTLARFFINPPAWLRGPARWMVRLGRSPWTQPLKNLKNWMINQPAPRQPLSSELRARLQDYFAPDLELFAELSGISVEDWLAPRTFAEAR